MEEIWKPIIHEGVTTHYEVDQFGAVRNIDTNFIVKPMVNTSGYLEAQIYINGKQRRIGIHRLVAKAFIPNPENKPEVNHIDGVKVNNNVTNLEWVTREENIQHSWRMGLRSPLRGEDSPSSKISEHIAELVCMCLVQGMHPLEIEKEYGVPRNISTDIARRKTWKHVSDRFPIPKTLKHGDFKVYHAKVDLMIADGYTNDEIKKEIAFDGMTKKEVKRLLKNRRTRMKKMLAKASND